MYFFQVASASPALLKLIGPTGGVVLNALVLPAVGAVPPPSQSLPVPAALLP